MHVMAADRRATTISTRSSACAAGHGPRHYQVECIRPSMPNVVYWGLTDATDAADGSQYGPRADGSDAANGGQHGPGTDAANAAAGGHLYGAHLYDLPQYQSVRADSFLLVMLWNVTPPAPAQLMPSMTQAGGMGGMGGMGGAPPAPQQAQLPRDGKLAEAQALKADGNKLHTDGSYEAASAKYNQARRLAGKYQQHIS
jgi:hypothetical protein